MLSDGYNSGVSWVESFLVLPSVARSTKMEEPVTKRIQISHSVFSWDNIILE